MKNPLMIIAVCGALLGLPAQFSAATPTRPQPASTQRMVERLAALDHDADPLAIPFFADKAVKFFEGKIAAAKSKEELLNLQLPYAGALLNNGQSEQALRETEKYEQMLRDSGRSLKPEEEPLLLLNKAIAALRMGE